MSYLSGTTLTYSAGAGLSFSLLPSGLANALGYDEPEKRSRKTIEEKGEGVMQQHIGVFWFVRLSPLLVFALLHGCIATKGWVQEQINPVNNRLSGVEGQMGQMNTRVGGLEGRVDGIIDRLDQLKLQRKLVLNVEEGAPFAFNSTSLSEGARQQIAGLFSDLGDFDMTQTIFLVAGHTDSHGSEDYNYVLGQRRASSVAQYMIRERGIDPLRVSTVSYGETHPIADNASRAGRQRNRRIEIWVYNEGITSSPIPPSGTIQAQRPQPVPGQTGSVY